MRLSNAIRLFLDDIMIRTSDDNFKYYVSKCSVLLRFMGNVKLKSIDKFKINDYIKAHKIDNPKISNASLNKEIATLKRIYKYNLGKELEYGKLKEHIKVTPTIKLDDLRKIFRYLNTRRHIDTGMRNLIFFTLLIETGARLNEILNIQIDDIDFEENEILLTTTKAKKERYVPIHENTRILIEDYIEEFEINSYLFISFSTNEIMTKNSVQTICKRMQNVLNIKKSISPHKWRHTFATQFAQATSDIESLRILLGHSTIRMTQRYLHIDRTHIRKQFDKVRHTDYTV